MLKIFHPCIQISLYIFSYLYANSHTALAQVTADNTVNTQVTINGEVAEITGGETRGNNLFHSFQDFSVATGNETFFNNANNVANIFSRVTGGNISNIDGLIRSNGTANLFLLNPAGILFGSNARLDIGGSFYGSTASSILFDVGEFSATDLKTPPVLTVNAPIGLQLRETAGEIMVQGVGNNLNFDLTSLAFIQGKTPPGLQVQPGKTLALIGNGVKLEGGNLFADGGKIEIGSVSTPNLVNLVGQQGNWTLDYTGISSFQNVELSGRASIDVSSSIGSGVVQVQGKNVTLKDGSAIFAFTGSQPGGNIEINAKDFLEIAGIAANGQVTSALYTAVSPNGTAKSGNLAIATDRFIARDGAQIGSDTYGIGDAGIITVQANESILLSGTSQDNVPTALGTFVQPGATGSGRQLDLVTKQLTIESGAQLITATLGEGSGATLTAKVSSLLELKGKGANTELPSAISSAVTLIPDLPVPTGDGGKINIEAGKLDISDRAQIIVSNQGLGDAGDINIISPSIVLSDHAQILAETAFGEGGNIQLKIADNLTMDNNSLISAKALNDANGGNVNINTDFIVAFANQIDGNGSDIIASADRGEGGTITINTDYLFGIEARKAESNNKTNDIDASSDFGLDGTVNIFTPDTNSFQGTTELPSNAIEAKQTTAQACPANREITGKNSLIVRGKGGIPATPDQVLTSQKISVNGQYIDASNVIPQPIATSHGKIELARGIKITEDGGVILTAYPSNNSPKRSPNINLNCI